MGVDIAPGVPPEYRDQSFARLRFKKRNSRNYAVGPLWLLAPDVPRALESPRIVGLKAVGRTAVPTSVFLKKIHHKVKALLALQISLV